MKKYNKINYPSNQEIVIDSIALNPTLRDDFDFTDNNLRPEKEVNHWWGLPYITTQSFMEESYQEYSHRCGDRSEPYDEWLIRKTKERTEWLEWFPDGVRYDVRLLDGGAWDRSTNKGSYKTFDEALEVAKNLHSLQ